MPRHTSPQHRDSGDPALQARIDQLFDEVRREDRDRVSEHKRLSEEQVHIIRRIRVRLVATAEDVLQFQDIESALVDWRRGVEAGNNDTRSPRDENDLTREQTLWLQKFHEEGGHVSALSPQQIMYIVRHGMIAMMEVPIPSRNDEEVYIPVGTVSALSPAPCSRHPLPLQPDERQPYEVFPNLDLHDLRMPDDATLNEVDEAASRTLTDYRSSIRGPLSTAQLRSEQLGPALLERLGGSLPAEWEGWNPRKLGLAALGKMMCVLALGEGKDLFTFNIGTVKSVCDGHAKRVVGTNAPSLGHNSYARPWAWRGYKDIIIPQVLTVYWQAYVAEMDRVKKWGMGLLEAKGYNLDVVHHQGNVFEQELRECSANGTHVSL